jgi:protein gp37
VGEITGIEWTDHTWNPWIGCQAVSCACDFCYAEATVKRFGGDFAERRRTSEQNWNQPFRWNRQAEAEGRRHRVFTCSFADFFDNKVPLEWRLDAWAVIHDTPWLDWQILTKRPQNIVAMLPSDWGDGWSNVWLGTTVENQKEADRRIPVLLDVPAAKRFLSCEPLLGPVDLDDVGLTKVDWVIAGGESGLHARPTHPDWFRDLRDQCVEAGVPFFMKQHGEWIGVPDLRNLPGGNGPGFGAFDHHPYDQEHEAIRVGKKLAGKTLDGREWQEFPESWDFPASPSNKNSIPLDHAGPCMCFGKPINPVWRSATDKTLIGYRCGECGSAWPISPRMLDLSNDS